MTSCGESNSDHAFSRGEYVERCRGLLQEERCCNGMTLSSQPCEDNSDLVEIAPALTERARPPPPYGGGSMVNWAVSGTTASTGMLPNLRVETSSLLVIDRHALAAITKAAIRYLQAARPPCQPGPTPPYWWRSPASPELRLATTGGQSRRGCCTGDRAQRVLNFGSQRLVAKAAEDDILQRFQI